MALSWLPQNIQRRVFRYILDRLAVFSNLDINDLDVQLGSTRPSLSLQNVRLDTERLSVPGIYFRDGRIGKLDLQLGASSGIDVSGSDVDLTIALSSKVLDEDEISAILSRTTADLAESIMQRPLSEISSPSDGSDVFADPPTSDSGTNFGVGDFSGIISKIMDTALSQISLKLRHISFKIIVDDLTVINASLAEVVFTTDSDSVRHLNASTFELFIWDTNEDSEGPMESDDDSDFDIEPSLMRSTIYSKAEASSLYMSAMSEVPERAYFKRSLLLVDQVSLSFNKILLSELKVNVGRVCISAMPISKFLEPLVGAFRNIAVQHSIEHEIQKSEKLEVPGSEPGKSTKNTDSFSLHGIFISNLEFNVGKEGFNQADDSDAMILSMSRTEVKPTDDDTWLATVSKVRISRCGKDIFSFDDDGDDLTFHQTTSKASILLPNAANIALNLSDINEIIDTFYSFASATSGLSPSKSGSSTTQQLYVRTNSFNTRIVHDGLSIQLNVFPFTFDRGLLSISRVSADISTAAAASSFVDINLFQIDTITRDGNTHHDSNHVKIIKTISTGLIKSKFHYQVIEKLRNFQKCLHYPVPEDGSELKGGVSLPDKMRKVRISDDYILLRLSVKSVELQLTLPGNIGEVDVELAGIFVDAMGDKSETAVNIEHVLVSKDFNQVDKSGRHRVVHSANISETGRPMIFMGLAAGEIKEVKLFNICLEYHVRILKLLEQGQKDENNEDLELLQNSVSTIKDSEVRFPIFLTDCSVGLNPIYLPAKALLVIRDGNAVVRKTTILNAELVILRASLLLVDDVSILSTPTTRRASTGGLPLEEDQIDYFLRQGYVPVSSLSASRCSVTVTDTVHMYLSSELLTLETCADSTQTLIQVINGLKPPLEISDALKYHTEMDPIDVFKFIDSNAFGDNSEGTNASDSISNNSNEDLIDDDLPTNLDFVESYYGGDSSRSVGPFGRAKIGGSSSSSSSMSGGMQYSKADLLLDQDLSTLVAATNIGPSQSVGGLNSSLSSSTNTGSQRIAVFEQRVQFMDSIDISEDHFSVPVQELPSSFDSEDDDNDGTPGPSNGPPDEEEKHEKIEKPIFSLKLLDSRVVWNLYDGYDWAHTQDTINNVVKKVEVAAAEARYEKLNQARQSEILPLERNIPAKNATSNLSLSDDDVDDNDPAREELIGNILFNSIYIGLPSGEDPRNLRRAINREIDEDASETASIATSNRSSSRGRVPGGRSDRGAGKLKLKRSKRNKVHIELTGLKAVVNVMAGVETCMPNDSQGAVLNRIRLWIKDVEVIDNVPSSTWNKFLTYMRSSGAREMNSSMISLSLDTVKPVPTAAVGEIILGVEVLPLRLHVDQDTLDFLTRFFEFKDERFIPMRSEADEDIFIQKADICTTKVKLDYKPKRVDYAGLKSGHTTEFMNFFILDEADIILKHVVLHGITGFERLSKMLNGIWMPDIRSTQLGGILSGLAPVRSLVRLGSGMRDLVVIPVKEYQKDQRVMRGIQKGAMTFAKTTSNELVKLGAKLAAGTQAILESAEEAMGGQGAGARAGPRDGGRYTSPYSDNPEDYEESYDSDDDDQGTIITAPRRSSHTGRDEKAKIVSLYADQPGGVNQGLQVAYQSFGRNLAIAKGALADIPGEATERGNAQGAAVAVMKAAPIAIIRPLIGATEAVSKALLGVTNQMDSEQKQEINDKYKQTRTESPGK